MSGKKKQKHKQQPVQNLAALADTYRIVGELSAHEHLREYLATRIADGTDVLILVAQAPPADAGNALTLFAADANLLSTLQHRNLVPIHEGRWIAPDQFAVVTDRCPAPTIETLIARGESWSYPRIATILHEANGLLEWARQQKVVHRTLTPGTIHLEPETDRVLASFVAQPLTRQGAPGAEGDARTIAQLAWALITRGRTLPASPEDSLGVVRPELPRRLIEATDALLHGQRVGETDPPTVLDYIGLVAMTDEIMRGEVNAAHIEALVYQEQVLEREAWAAKEREYEDQILDRERQMLQDREELANTLATEREQMADTLATERAEMERTIAAEREAMERTLASEREAMEHALATERAAMESTLTAERERMAGERAALEQQIADEREQLARERAALLAEIAAEREQTAQERAAHQAERAAQEAEIAEERAAMAATIAEERAALEQRLAEERARLEATLSEEQQRLLDDRTAAETALATARAEFEAAMAAQRAELEAQLAREREEFDRAIIAEREALEAEREGFAVFNAAERDAIEAERRALEELYLAYEADGHMVEEVDDDRPDGGRPGAGERAVPPLTARLADIAPIAVAQPVSEPAPDPTSPAETDTGRTRDDVKRAGRAAWGVPASVILLVAVITATAVGIGTDEQGALQPRDEQPRAVAQPGQRAAAPAAPTVIDSAGGSVVVPDTSAATVPTTPSTTAPRLPGTSPPDEERSASRTASRDETIRQPVTAAPARPFDTALAATGRSAPTVPPASPRRDSAIFLPATIPQPVIPGPPRDTAPRDTTPAIPLPMIPSVPPSSFPGVRS